MSPAQQARVKAAIKRTLQLRREFPQLRHEEECAAARETAELLQRLASKKSSNAADRY